MPFRTCIVLTSMSRKAQIQLVLVASFVLISVSVSRMLSGDHDETVKNTQPPQLMRVDTVHVSPAPTQIEFQMTGSVQASREVSIVPSVSGQVVYVHPAFNEGGMLPSGEALFRLDKRDYAYDVARLLSEFSRAKTAYATELALSEAALNEWRALEGDEAEMPPLAARTLQLEQAAAQVKAAEGAYERARLNLQRTSFRLPYPVRVTQANIGVGQFVSPPQSLGQVYALASLEIKASISEQQWLWLSRSKENNITARVGDTEYVAYIKRGAAALDPKTRFANIYFGVKGNTDVILPGTFVTLDIKGVRLPSITTLPKAALQKDERLWLVNEQDRLFALRPDIVFDNGRTIMVRGLPENARVVTHETAGMTEGMKVKEYQER